MTYLVYEILFLFVALYFWTIRIPRNTADRESKRWLRQLTVYAMVYYFLWATADVLILSGVDVGFALRIVPNQLYYALFLPFAYWSAPHRLRRRKARLESAGLRSEVSP
jgi:hypothetical protein